MRLIPANERPTVNDHFLTRVEEEQRRGNTEIYLRRWEIPDIIYNSSDCSREDAIGQCEVDIRGFSFEEEDETEQRLSHIMRKIVYARFCDDLNNCVGVYADYPLDSIEKNVLIELGYTINEKTIRW